MFIWISRHRLLTVFIVIMAISLSVAISASDSNPISGFILKYFEDWAPVFRTIGTVTAAYLAYVAIIEGHQIREESVELEHKRRSLEGIIEWTRQVQKLCFQRGSSRQIAEVEAVVAAGDWVVMTAAIFGQDFKALVNQARNEIASCTMETAEPGEKIESEAILKSVNDVLEAAFRLKIQLKI